MPGEPPQSAETSEKKPWLTPRQRFWALIGTALVALVALSVVVSLVVVPAVKRQQAADVVKSRVHTAGLEHVWWADSGRYAVIQDFRADGTPVVTVWDAQTHASRAQAGYVALRVDDASDTAILEPVGAAMVASMTAGRPLYPLAGTAWFDSTAPTAMKWLFSKPGTAPTYDSAGYRLSWPAIEARIVLGKGSGWSEMRSAPQFAAGRRFILPAGVLTVSPIGWSPSRRYFAVEELRRVPPSGELTREAPRGVYVFAPDSSLPVATATVETSAQPVWAGPGDRLVWIAPAEIAHLPFPGAPRKPGAAPGTAFTGLSFSATGSVGRFAEQPSGTPEVLFDAENSGATPLWWSRTTDVTQFWQLPPGNAPLAKRFDIALNGTQWAWNDEAGLLGVVPETALGSYRTVVYFLPPKGGMPVVIYKGELRSATRAKGQ